ncbi:glycosyltransferase family protein [Owenweeksia hongkongensis]|uniref:glycosyltransferase family protein n=1 Tax=Owenweeksia hongkongensis TaxID=253245 RepID=UPI003A936102
MKNKPTILYGILNWGLGHATRSIPIIHKLLEHGFEVVICSDGLALDFLKKEFPDLATEPLRGYNVKYRKGMGQIWGLTGQLPKIYTAMKAEHRAVKKLVEKYKATAVISDNRLEFYHKDLPSVYITHQLKIIMPLNTDFASALHHRFIRKFDVCWVPDFGGEGISGAIGHELKPKIPVEYIGPCSRFTEAIPTKVEKKYRIATILSGPEPQRTLLETKLLKELSKLEGQHLMIRGTDRPMKVEIPENVKVKDLVGAEGVYDAISKAKTTISRSGYSSLMDYYALKNHALLIPTPGQPEQEYLARFQLHKGRFAYVGQDYINLPEDLAKAEMYKGFKDIESKETDWERLFSFLKSKGES